MATGYIPWSQIEASPRYQQASPYERRQILERWREEANRFLVEGDIYTPQTVSRVNQEYASGSSSVGDQVAPVESGQGGGRLGAIGRAAVRSVVPTATGILAGVGTGALVGTAGAGPIGTAIGAIGGGIAGAFGGEYIQQAALDTFAPDVSKAMREQAALDREKYPVSTFVGETIPQLATARPSLGSLRAAGRQLLGREATDLGRASLANVAIGAGVGGGSEAAAGFATGSVDPTRIALATLTGGALTDPTALGRSLGLSNVQIAPEAAGRRAPGEPASQQPPIGGAPVDVPPPLRPERPTSILPGTNTNAPTLRFGESPGPAEATLTSPDVARDAARLREIEDAIVFTQDTITRIRLEDEARTLRARLAAAQGMEYTQVGAARSPEVTPPTAYAGQTTKWTSGIPVAPDPALKLNITPNLNQVRSEVPTQTQRRVNEKFTSAAAPPANENLAPVSIGSTNLQPAPPAESLANIQLPAAPPTPGYVSGAGDVPFAPEPVASPSLAGLRVEALSGPPVLTKAYPEIMAPAPVESATPVELEVPLPFTTQPNVIPASTLAGIGRDLQGVVTATPPDVSRRVASRARESGASLVSAEQAAVGDNASISQARQLRDQASQLERLAIDAEAGFQQGGGRDQRLRERAVRLAQEAQSVRAQAETIERVAYSREGAPITPLPLDPGAPPPAPSFPVQPNIVPAATLAGVGRDLQGVVPVPPPDIGRRTVSSYATPETPSAVQLREQARRLDLMAVDAEAGYRQSGNTDQRLRERALKLAREAQEIRARAEVVERAPAVGAAESASPPATERAALERGQELRAQADEFQRQADAARRNFRRAGGAGAARFRQTAERFASAAQRMRQQADAIDGGAGATARQPRPTSALENSRAGFFFSPNLSRRQPPAAPPREAAPPPPPPPEGPPLADGTQGQPEQTPPPKKLDVFAPTDPGKYANYSEFVRSMRTVGERAMRNFVDALRPLREAMNIRGVTITGEANIAEAANRYLGSRQNTLNDVLSLAANNIVKRGEALASRMSARGIQMRPSDVAADMQKYMHALHAPEANEFALNKVLAKVEDGADLTTTEQAIQAGLPASGLTNEQAAAEIRRIRQTYGEEVAELDAMRGQLRDISQDSVRLLREAGVLSDEAADDILTRYKNYVPLQRILEDDPDFTAISSGLGSGGLGTGVTDTSIRERIGSMRDIDDIMSSVINQYQAAISRSARNEYDISQANFWRLNRDIFKGVDKLGREVQLVEELSAKQAMERSPSIISKNYKDGVIPFYRNGQKRFLVFNLSEEGLQLAESAALARVKPENVLAGVSAFNRFLGQMVTTYNPNFALVNFVRDSAEMVFNLTRLMGREGAMRAFLKQPSSVRISIARELFSMGETKAALRLANEDELDFIYDMFKDSGGIGSFSVSQLDDTRVDIKRMWEHVSQKGVTRTLYDSWSALSSFVKAANSALENATRFSAYRAARESSNYTRNEAAYIARNSTIDFRTGGRLAPVMNSLFIFFNPGVQGASNAIRVLRDPEARLAALTAVTSISLIGSVYNDSLDEEWRRDVRPIDRDSGIIVVNPIEPRSLDGTLNYAVIPFPYSLRPLKVASEAVVDIASGADVNAEAVSDRLVNSTLDVINPLGGNRLQTAAFPTILRPVVDVATNKSFTGAVIRPPNADPMISQSQNVFAETDQTATGRTLMKIGGALEAIPGLGNIMQDAGLTNPENINYFVRGYLGGPATFTQQVVDTSSAVLRGEAPSVRDVPIASRFLRSVPPEEIQTRRFSGDTIADIATEDANERAAYRRSAQRVVRALVRAPEEERKRVFEELVRSGEVRMNDPVYAEYVEREVERAVLNYTPEERRLKALSSDTGARAKGLKVLLDEVPQGERAAFLQDLLLRRVVTMADVDGAAMLYQ